MLLLVVAGCNFLAYGTTQRVAHQRGADRPAEAAAVGVQALWLALLLGVPLALLVGLLAEPAVRLLGGSGEVLDIAVTYLRISAVGLPFVLVALVGNGVLRGVADLRTPLVILVIANAGNVVLELIAVYALDYGIAGSAWSTVVVQVLAAVAFLVALAPHLAPAVTRRPDRAEMSPLLLAGRHLLVRVGGILAVTTASTAVAARVDDVTLAAHQIVVQAFNLLALILDALAIPAQTLVAAALGRWFAPRRHAHRATGAAAVPVRRRRPRRRAGGGGRAAAPPLHPGRRRGLPRHRGPAHPGGRAAAGRGGDVPRRRADRWGRLPLPGAGVDRLPRRVRTDGGGHAWCGRPWASSASGWRCCSWLAARAVTNLVRFERGRWAHAL